MSKIIQIEPWIDEEEAIQLQRVIQSTFVVEHELTKEFEQLTVELTRSKHAIAMSNGTMALFCALKALDIGAGDEVIVPDLTFVATANAVILAGATPVFCDVDMSSYCIDIESMVQVMTAKTRAIIPVHLYGQSAEIDKVMEIAGERSIHVIEDAAQAVGVSFDGQHVGTFGEAGILSYYGNKTITCGEGGILLTDSDDIATACYRLKNHGRDQKGTFVHEHIGFNFSFTEMQAAIGIAQMHKLERIKEKKREIRDRYNSEFAAIDALAPQTIDDRCDPVFWFTSFLCDCRDELEDYLEKKDIQTRRFFYPLHLQPCYKGVLEHKCEFNSSEMIFNRGISLPSSVGLTESQQSEVISAVKSFFA